MGIEASAIYEEEFALIYNVPGITYSDVEQMPRWERRAFLELLLEQRKQEQKAEEQAMQSAQGAGGMDEFGFNSGGQDLMQMPLGGEMFGSADANTPPSSASFVQSSRKGD